MYSAKNSYKNHSREKYTTRWQFKQGPTSHALYTSGLNYIKVEMYPSCYESMHTLAETVISSLTDINCNDNLRASFITIHVKISSFTPWFCDRLIDNTLAPLVVSTCSSMIKNFAIETIVHKICSWKSCKKLDRTAVWGLHKFLGKELFLKSWHKGTV
jgi:hypothetical protein